MKILHITPHLGGGVGTVIMDWMSKDKNHDYSLACLDYVNSKAVEWSIRESFPILDSAIRHGTWDSLCWSISYYDIVLVHYWDHPMLEELFSRLLPDCRMVFWCHKNIRWNKVFPYPDRFINTSPVQKYGSECIWSTGNMDRFLAIEPKPHEGFNIGTVISKKMDVSKTFGMFMEIAGKIPDARFFWIGDAIPVNFMDFPDFTFTGKVDDVAPYLAEMDVFAYPLRPDHYGTCEIALGEAMAAGVVPVVMDNPAERTIIVDGKSGYIEPDMECFIDAFRFLRSKMLRHYMGLRAKDRAKELYSIDNQIASWNQVFESMMQNPKTKRSPI